jgi:anti-sigma factor RsiW
MNHIDEDLLMKYALQLLGKQDEAALQEHISECSDCRARLELIRREIELIGSLEPRVEKPPIPLPKTRGFRIPVWLRAAALLFAGFMIGYGASLFSEDQVVFVVPHRVSASPYLQEHPDITYYESVDMTYELYPEARNDTVSR